MIGVLLLASWTIGSLDCYVAPDGDDLHPGTFAQPYKTLGKALDFAASERAGHYQGQINILVRGGNYYLPETLKVDPTVSSPDHLTVISAYKNEAPSVVGGLQLGNWTRSGAVYTTHVPGTYPVREVFVNGTRYRRPRLPEAGYYYVADIVPAPDRTTKGDHSMVVPSGAVDPKWSNFSSVEAVIFHNWEISRLPLRAFNPASNVVTFSGATQPADWGLIHKGARFLIENVKEALHLPGQFYFDPVTRQISLIPLPGQDPTVSEVLAPNLEKVVEIAGTKSAPVSNLQFKGITFRDSAWNMPNTGRTFPQAEADMGGAVAIHDARNIVFENCRIRQTGGYGLEIGDDAQAITFESGKITDLGAGGVKIGTMDLKSNEQFVTRHVAIMNSLIAGGGRVHPAGVGIWVGQSPDVTLSGNEICDFTYTGISLGWSWGYGATNTHDSRIFGNHIHDIGRGVLSDMGGIYHLGVDPGTVISGNRIHDVKSFDYGGWGLYLDEGSTDVTMEDNIVYRCSRESFHQHYGKNNVIRRNILALSGEAQLARTRNEDHLSFTLENNVVYWQGTPLLWGNWDGTVHSDSNLFWRTDRVPITFGNLTLAAWRQLGRDVHSIFEDPQFVDPVHEDFRIKQTSPALKLGFSAMNPKGEKWPSQWKLLPAAFPEPGN